MFSLQLTVIALLGCSCLITGQLTGLLDFGKCPDLDTEAAACATTYPAVSVGRWPEILQVYRSNSTLCSHIAEYKLHMACFQKAAKKCVRSGLLDLFASVEASSRSLDIFCQRRSSFKESCFLSSLQEVAACQRQSNIQAPPANSTTYADLKDYTCKITDVTINCFTNNSGVATCQDTRTTMLLMSQATIPPPCSATGMMSCLTLLFVSVLASVMLLR